MTDSKEPRAEVGGLPYPAGRLIEQPDPRAEVESVTIRTAAGDVYRVNGGTVVDPAGQALVWGLTASGHAAEALTALTRKHELLERGADSEEDAAELEVVTRLHAYHDDAHRIADKCAGTWALVASVQPVPDTDLDAAFQAGLHYSDESPQDGKSGRDA